MRGFTKEDVQTHNDGGIGGPYYPAVNVKADHFAQGLDAEERFGCSEAVASQAVKYAWESATEAFWQDRAEAVVEQYFGKGTQWGGAGRGGGWLVVEGIGFPEDWGGVELNRWACFEKAIDRLVAYLCSAEKVAEDIEANRWAEDGAEAYNFVDTPAGPRCLVELNRHKAVDAKAFAAGATL